MKNSLLKALLFLSLVFVFFKAKSQTLIMNEVSNGPSGSQEYVEFVVVSNSVSYNCNSPTPPCIDIRGWIFDDNSGYHGTSGIAAGAIRFSQDPIWSCIPLGTIILIYNDADKNPGIPSTDDLSMSDGNCTIIAPISNTSLFERNTTTPGAAACSYPATGWVAGGNWTYTALANSSDCARIVNLSGCEVFSVCYGATDNLNTLIYFPASGTGTVYSFNSIDPQQQANWSSGSATTMQTPGMPNNAANAAYIAQFNNGCLPITPINVTASSTNAGCSCNGTATANASGSIGGYTYAWYDASFNPIGQTNATATGLCAGVYKVIAKSSIGCSDTTSVTITSSASTSLTVNSQTICAGNTTILTASPSAGGGTFLWSPSSQTTSSISINPSTTTSYSVTYTLAGCIATANALVTVIPQPTVTVNSATICSGSSIVLNASGASTYSWSSGANTNSLTVNPSSNTIYTITGTTSGCSNTAISNIFVNPLPTVTVNSSTICSGASITLIANGATSYLWNTGATSNSIIVSPSSNSNYTVTGTSSSCTNTAVSNIVVNTSPTVTVNSSTICAGQSASLMATGANTYLWNTGATSNSLTISPLTTTNYTVLGTSSGCTNSIVTTVSVIPLPTVSVNSTTLCSGQSTTLTALGAASYTWNSGVNTNSLAVSPITTTDYTVVGATSGCTNSAIANLSVTPLPTVTVNSSTVCFGSSATLNATGANTYTWSNGSSINPISVSPSSNTSYSVIGSALGCTNIAVANVTVTPLPIVTVNSNSICSGQSATLNATGANTYTWNTGLTTNSLTVSPSINTTYTVVGTSLGCSNTAVAGVSVIPLPTVTVNSNSICAGQTITLIATGANTYIWNNGINTNSINVSPSSNTTYSVIGTTSGCTNTAVSNISVTPLPTVTVNSSTICAGSSTTLVANGAATYTWSTGSTNGSITENPVTTTSYSLVGELLGCINSATTNIVVSPNLSLSVNTPTICIGQAATLMSSGATTYTWSNGTIGNSITVSPSSTTSFSVSGVNGTCSGTTVATVIVNPLPIVTVNSSTICSGQTTTLTASGASTYTWSNGFLSNFITDSPSVNSTHTVVGSSLGCTNTAVATISVIPLPTITVNSSTICAGLSATLSAVGANSYSWSNGLTTNSLIVSPLSNTVISVTGSLNGCSSTATANILVLPNPTLSVNSATICEGVTATLTVSGASSYIWDTGATSSSISESPPSNKSYTVTGTSLGCSSTAIANIFVTPLPTVTVNSSTICLGQTSTLTANGANAYLWSTGATGNQLVISPTLNTTYSVIGTTNGCSNSISANVNVIIVPVLSLNSSTICAGETTILTASGANSFQWNNGATTNSISVSPTTSSVYSVSGTNGLCSSTATTNVIVNQLPSLTVTSQTICSGQNATLTVSGASSYIWNTGSTSNTLITSPNNTSTYTVVGTLFNCTSSATTSVIVKAIPNILFNANKTFGCAPLCVQFSDLSSVSGSTITNWNWTFNDGYSSNIQNPSHCFDKPGIYNISLLVTASNGCSKSFTNPNMINVLTNPIAEFTSDALETDILNPVINFTNLSTNANEYVWSFGGVSTSTLTNPSHTFNQEGVYSTTLTATNQLGCKSVVIHDIIVNGIFTFYAPNTFTPNDDNINDIFLPLGVGWDPEKYQLDIFDRWGNNCFNTKEVGKGWDGRANNGSEAAQIDTYTWKVDLTDIFGKNHKYIGRVTIIR